MGFNKKIAHTPFLSKNLSAAQKMKFPTGYSFAMNNSLWRVAEEIDSGPDEYRRVRSDSGEEEVMLLAVLQRDALNIDSTSNFVKVSQGIDLDNTSAVKLNLSSSQLEQEELKAIAASQRQKRLAAKSKIDRNIQINDEE